MINCPYCENQAEDEAQLGKHVSLRHRVKEHQIRTAIKAYLDAGGDEKFFIISKKEYENSNDKSWRKQVRRELKALYRVALRAATSSTHDTLPVMIAMSNYVKSKGVKL